MFLMRPKIIIPHQAYFSLGNNSIGLSYSYRAPATARGSFFNKTHNPSCVVSLRIPSSCPSSAGSKFLQGCCRIKHAAVNVTADDRNQGISLPEEEEDYEELCPVECVREFKTDEEFSRIIEKSKKTKALVVVDFYRTSCGSCKYIEQGFSKLCKGSGDDETLVVFLKHNVMDEYDEQSEVAERLRIKTVPLFHFYKDGILVEAFATRDKDRITQAIDKYTSPKFQES